MLHSRPGFRTGQTRSQLNPLPHNVICASSPLDVRCRADHV